MTTDKYKWPERYNGAALKMKERSHEPRKEGDFKKLTKSMKGIHS